MSIQTKEILESLSIADNEGVYYIGTDKRGITIYKQQVRALNLIYSLQKEGKLDKDTSVAIIGGGFAGITASAAALTIGCKVRLLEQKSILLHLQTGCKTRWVHPNIYDWPADGSEFPYAALPLLDWKEGYSSDVSQDILDKYAKITAHHRDNYIELLGAHFNPIDFSTRTIEVKKSLNPDFVSYVSDYDVIILATGFGLETGVQENSLVQANSSYWRNDDLDQPYIGKKSSTIRDIVISGTGDGACIEILRSLITNFHQGRLIENFFASCKDSTQLKTELNIIRLESLATRPDSSWLYKRFSGINQSLLHDIKTYLKSQLRPDTNLCVLGQEKSINQIFTTERMSLFNAFAVYLLKLIGSFEYFNIIDFEPIGGKRSKKKAISLKLSKPIDGKKVIELGYDILIVRHGPGDSIKASLQSVGLPMTTFAASEATSIRIWEPGWPLNDKDRYGIEFVPPLSKAIVTTFIEILGETLQVYHKDKSFTFRVTLDRFIEINSAIYFQQVCRYSGSEGFNQKPVIGRIFHAEFGLVGFAAKTGKVVLLTREDDFKQTVEFMGIEKLPAGEIRKDLNSMLCIPIFSLLENDKYLINSVVYLDSSEKDFFSEDVIDIVVNSCQGFVKNIDNMIINKEIRASNNSINNKLLGKGRVVYGNFKSLKMGERISPKLKLLRLAFKQISAFDLYE